MATAEGLGLEKANLNARTKLEIAAVFVNDAIHGRNKRHRVNQPARRAHKVLRNKIYHASLTLIMMATMGLAIVEAPSTFRSLLEPWWSPMITNGVELACVFLFCVDLYLRFLFLGSHRFKTNKWVLMKLIYIAVAAVNICIAFGVPNVPRLHRILRPMILVAQFRNVQKIFGNMIRSVPRVTKVTVLLAFHVMLSGVFAYVTFGGISREDCHPDKPSGDWCTPFYAQACTDYFGHFGNSMNQLFILLTTANYPDIMMPVYDCIPAASLFFIFFVMVGCYFIMNLVLAVAYSVFQEQSKKMFLKTVRKRIECLDEAFDYVCLPSDMVIANGVLTYARPTAATSLRMGSMNAADLAPERGLDRSSSGSATALPLVTASPLQAVNENGTLTSTLTPPLSVNSSAKQSSNDQEISPKVHLERDMSANSRFEGALKELSLASMRSERVDRMASLSVDQIEARLRRQAPDGVITLDVFQNLMAIVRPSAREVVVDLIFHALNTSKTGFLNRLEFRELTTFVELTVKYKPGRGGSAAYLCGRCMSARMLHFRQLVRRICTNKFFQIIFELLVYVNGVLIMLQFGMDDTSTTYKQIDIVQQILLTLFGVEIIIKILGLGWREFWADGFNRFDCLIVPVAAVSEIVVATAGITHRVVSRLSFLRMLRLFRALRALKGFRVILRTFTAIFPTFMRYLAVLFVVYYQFAIIGMETFAGVITRGTESVVNTAYGSAVYYSNNFNALGNGLVTLFELMVVNNWAITMEGHVAATTHWAMVFFYAWFFVIVIVVLNIVTAFLLDDFTVMRAQLTDDESGTVPEWKERLLRSAESLAIKDRRHFLLRRTIHPSHVSEIMFSEEVSALLHELRTNKGLESPDAADDSGRESDDDSNIGTPTRRRGRQGLQVDPFRQFDGWDKASLSAWSREHSFNVEAMLAAETAIATAAESPYAPPRTRSRSRSTVGELATQRRGIVPDSFSASNLQLPRNERGGVKDEMEVAGDYA